ncbi:olfactory receptor 14A16-like [Melospiza georgiana]|uniref:olfactory receptor 14A16-like n=1 Tax=Melospiza georgiana TaxID=44398 RepID=UPI0025ACADF8|nr:olfactory receptor 14A16-like [Melospiza georgiana]
MSNSSSIRHFLLLALADTRQLQLLHFCPLLGISLAALLGNGLIISAVACSHHLHTPMFFFLLNLALSDLGSICTTVPKAMHNSLWDTSTISYKGCAAQVFFFLFFITAEFSLLTAMCYDRYVSICKPLHYGTLLGSRACAHMAAAAWASAFLYSLLHTANTFSLPLCHGNALGQFFCEIPQILKLSCSKSYLRELGLIVLSALLFFVCFVFMVFSYTQIFRAVLRIPSEQGRHKAFSTCLPHLAVVSLFVSTSFFAYLKPPSISSPSRDLAVSILYLVVPPALNPLIYSLRNQELKDALGKPGMENQKAERPSVKEPVKERNNGSKGPQATLSASKRLSIFDYFVLRISDSHKKVKQRALVVLAEITGALKDALNPVIIGLVEGITKNLNSKDPRVGGAAVKALEESIAHLVLVQGVHARSPEVVQRDALPVLWPCLENKALPVRSTNVRTVATKLASALCKVMGTQLKECATSKPPHVRENLSKIHGMGGLKQLQMEDKVKGNHGSASHRDLTGYSLTEKFSLDTSNVLSPTKSSPPVQKSSLSSKLRKKLLPAKYTQLQLAPTQGLDYS